MIKCNQKDILSIINNIYEVVSNAEFNNIEKFSNDFLIIAKSRTGNFYLCYINGKLFAYKVIS